jgi:hypothetical protein
MKPSPRASFAQSGGDSESQIFVIQFYIQPIDLYSNFCFSAMHYIGGILAAVQIPVAYFALFGRQNAEFGHAVLNLGLHALPTALLIAGGILAVHRLWPTHRPMTWVPVSLGMVSCLLLWALVLSPAQLQPMDIQSKGAFEELRSMLAIPWWAASNVMAPWFGVGLAAWLTSGGRHRVQRSGA